MFDWLKKLRRRLSRPKSPTLLDYAENYLVVFAAGDNDEKNRHGRKLFDVANEVSSEVGVRDFLDLINKSDEDTLRVRLSMRGHGSKLPTSLRRKAIGWRPMPWRT